MLPVEAFVTGIKVFAQQSVLDCLIFKGSKVKLQSCNPDPTILEIERPS